MKCLKIEPSRLEGKIRVPPSKSISHRALICAGLAEGISRIENIGYSEDVEATLDGMKELGAKVADKAFRSNESDWIAISGNRGLPKERPPGRKVINCRESGSTLRFLIPLASAYGREITFRGQGKLGERPLEAYYRIFQEQGIAYRTTGGGLPLTVSGKMQPGIFRLEGNISSQFISGLLFYLPLLEAGSQILLTTPLESGGYVALTLAALAEFGVRIENREERQFIVPGKQSYCSRDYLVEGDYSQAAFWIVAGILGGSIACLGLNPDSLQGDKAILDLSRQMGAGFQEKDGSIEIMAAETVGTEINAEQVPDLVPILTVLAVFSKGVTRIVKAGRLRIKESDRLKAMATELNKLGAQIRELEEGLLIQGVESLQGGKVDSWNDHRIAMALAIASTRCTGPVYLNGYEAVRKSYPHFWKDFADLGGRFNERDLG